jgi:uncharacterized protein YjiS (DUF1127 family)
MSMIETAATLSTTSPLVMRLAAWPVRLAVRLRQRMEIRQRRRLLHQMPDFLLKDIGIYRSDIDGLVEAAVLGRPDPTRHPGLFESRM